MEHKEVRTKISINPRFSFEWQTYNLAGLRRQRYEVVKLAKINYIPWPSTAHDLCHNSARQTSEGSKTCILFESHFCSDHSHCCSIHSPSRALLGPPLVAYLFTTMDSDSLTTCCQPIHKQASRHLKKRSSTRQWISLLTQLLRRDD